MSETLVIQDFIPVESLHPPQATQDSGSFPASSEDSRTDAVEVPREPAVAVEEVASSPAGEEAKADVLSARLSVAAKEIASSLLADDMAQQRDALPPPGTAAVGRTASCFPTSDTLQHADVLSMLQALVVEELAAYRPADGIAHQADAQPVPQAVALEGITSFFPASDTPQQARVAAIQTRQLVEEVAESLPSRGGADERSQTGFLGFYGLREQPFGVSPDPAYLYFGREHHEAFTSLLSGIHNDRGFMALIAEPGMGKTTLLNKLMEELRSCARTVFLFQTQCSSKEFFRHLLSELGVKNAGMDPVSMHNKLNEVLFQEMLTGKRFVLIVDEAQNLDDSVLETIRLLSDFEAKHAKLLQIILAGQPPLAEKLMHPGLSQLRQRISVLASLEPFTEAETGYYIEHRLQVAGGTAGLCFTPEALALIAERSQGIPRTINNTCFNALMAGFSQRRKPIDSDMVREETRKLDLESLVRRFRQTKPAVEPAPTVVADNSLPCAAATLAPSVEQSRSDRDCSHASKPTARTAVTLDGKLTNVITTGHWGKEREFRAEVSLKREPFSSIPVGERYYCSSFYIGEEQAKAFRTGQPIRIIIEQD